MKVAVTYERGMVFQHFGHTEEFKLYEVVDDAVVKAQVVGTDGSGHGALVDFLTAHGVEILICGGIGGGAQAALASAGIKLYGGVGGYADDAVTAFIAGELNYDPDVQCNHHGHGEGEHPCHSHGHHGGSHSCH